MKSSKLVKEKQLMLINIDDNFTLNVPRFTEEYKDLVKLYKLNFGGWEFDNDIYNTLSNKIIDSKNTNWDKAIALTILNQKLIAKIIFKKDENNRYPLSRFQHHITYIVEFLAMKGIKAYIKQRNTTNYCFSTHIGNSVLFSSSIEKLDKNGWLTSTQKKSITRKKTEIKEWNHCQDLVRQYRRKYGKLSFERLPLLEIRIDQLERIKEDTKKEIKLLKNKIIQLQKIQKEKTWWWSSNYDKEEYEKLYVAITTSSGLKELKDITSDFKEKDFEKMIDWLQKDIEEYQDQSKLTKNLEKIKEEHSLLLNIQMNTDKMHLHPKSYLTVEKIDLMGPATLTNTIDSFAYCKPNQDQFLDYQSLQKDIEKCFQQFETYKYRYDITPRKLRNAIQVLKLRYLVSNPQRTKTFKYGAQRSFKEIGTVMGISDTTVRQLHYIGLQNLREPHFTNKLRDYLDDVPLNENIVDDDSHLPYSWND